MKLKIKVKRINKNIALPEVTEKGDWIDLRASETVTLNAPQANVLKRHKVNGAEESNFPKALRLLPFQGAAPTRTLVSSLATVKVSLTSLIVVIMMNGGIMPLHSETLQSMKVTESVSLEYSLVRKLQCGRRLNGCSALV